MIGLSLLSLEEQDRPTPRDPTLHASAQSGPAATLKIPAIEESWPINHLQWRRESRNVMM
jgi:hypothetical protein